MSINLNYINLCISTILNCYKKKHFLIRNKSMIDILFSKSQWLCALLKRITFFIFSDIFVCIYYRDESFIETSEVVQSRAVRDFSLSCLNGINDADRIRFIR